VKTDIKSLTPKRLEEGLAAMGEPRYRAAQIFGWLHRQGTLRFEEMQNLPLALRRRLDEEFYINALTVRSRQQSADGTVKYLFGLRDGNTVETVLMRHHHGNSLCVSSQVGCRMGCRFCASTQGGLVRGLTPAEILDQVYASGRESGLRIDSVVLMGIGEPLDNYDNVVTFLELITVPEGLNMSHRHISLSTCGLADGIDRLAELKLQLTLSVSLHAADDRIRTELMPVNRLFGIEALMAACRRYIKATGRRVSFEYALFDGVNDGEADAVRLAALVRGMNCHVNLIPANPVAQSPYRRSPRAAQFLKKLQTLGVNATMRRELGTDIAAACGQLRRQTEGGITQ
jgi:23S rRNA (adenine2503-C2)-methyltransferase